MDLLKEGVKTLSQRLNTFTELDPINISSSKSCCKSKTKRIQKQMILNNKLELLRTDKVIKVS